MAGNRSALIQTAHTYLETINEKNQLSAFLGLRSDLRAILIDKADSAYGTKVSSEIGMQIKANSRDLQAAIWAIGLTRHVPNSSIQELTELLKGICEEINYR